MDQKRIVFTVTMGELAEIPGTPLSYWASHKIRDLFVTLPPLDRDQVGKKTNIKVSDIKSGLSTADDVRFTRYWWEATTSLTELSAWVPFAKKGSKPFFIDLPLLIRWKANGDEIRHFTRATIRNESYYFKPGLIWASIVTSERLEVARVPPGCIFSPSGGGGLIFCPNEKTYSSLLSLLNSRLLAFLFQLLNQLSHSREIGTIAKLPISLSALANDELAAKAEEAHDILREWYVGIETSTVFILPSILMVWSSLTKQEITSFQPKSVHPLAGNFKWSDWESARLIRSLLPNNINNDSFSLKILAETCLEREKQLQRRISELQSEIDEEIYREYKISSDDRTLIETELNSIPIEELTDNEEIEKEEEEEEEDKGIFLAEEHQRQLVHYFVHEIVKSDTDGIVPLHDTYLPDGKLELGLITLLRQRLSDTFGSVNLETIERDLLDIFGMPIEEWIETEFFPYHVTFYRLRPILWQITSRSRGKPIFSCLIYWQKLDSDTLRKIQQVYLRPLVDTSRQEAERLNRQLNDLRVSGGQIRLLREAERVSHQAEDRWNELKSLQERVQALLQPHTLTVQSHSAWVIEKVNEILAHGYQPELEYGVRVNIEPLKQAGILPQAANRVKG